MLTLLQYSYRNLWVRRLTTLLTATGMGLVVFVFAAVLMLAEGLEKSLVSTGSRDNIIFIRRSSETEVQSILERQQAAVLESLPEIAVGSDSRHLVARELIILIGLKKKSTNSLANITLRGVEPDVSLALRPQVRLIQGRPFQPGTTEVILGRSVAQRFAVGGLGQVIQFANRSWTVVGILDAGGAAFDSEIWADVEMLMSAFRRPVYSSVVARLQDPSGIVGVRERVTADPRLTVDVFRETDYYAAQSALMARFIRILGVTLTLIFSLGAIIGSMVTMYGAVANRVAEIGTLRALGFQRRTILNTFLAESLFLSLMGGFIGLLGAALMNRLTISTMNWQTFSELTFRFHLSWSVLFSALSFSIVMGLMGGMLPAFRAARLDIVSALRSK